MSKGRASSRLFGCSIDRAAVTVSISAADPATPCGFVGGQAPCIWGGYDYAKLIKKIQFIEAYNIGSSQAIIRSLKDAGRMGRDAGIFLRGWLRRQRPVLKDPFAVFSAPWFASRSICEGWRPVPNCNQ